MLRRFTRTSLAARFRLLVVLVLLMGCLMAFLLLGHGCIANAHSRARTVANLVEDVGTWASKYQGAWLRVEAAEASRSGDFLEIVPVFKQDTDPAESLVGGFHLKNPALIQRELSEVSTAAGHLAKFRMTSDRFMNPANAPTRFELAAIESLRESGGVEMSEIKGDRLLYSRRITATPACMACHDTAAKAPASVRAHYPEGSGGYGYKLGEMVGVISVSVPILEGSGGLFDSVGGVGSAGIAAFLASLALLLWFVQSAIIDPIRQLSNSTSQASEADIVEIQAASLRFTQADESSRNEIQRLGVAVKRLLRSLKVQGRY